MLGRIGNSPQRRWLKDKEGKSVKIEQRKAKGKSEDRSEDQVEQTALLASTIYIAQARGEEKTYKKRSQRAGALSSLRLFGLACSHARRMYFPAIF